MLHLQAINQRNLIVDMGTQSMRKGTMMRRRVTRRTLKCAFVSRFMSTSSDAFSMMEFPNNETSGVPGSRRGTGSSDRGEWRTHFGDAVACFEKAWFEARGGESLYWRG